MAGKDVSNIADEIRLTFIRGLRENEQLAAKLNFHDVTGDTVSRVRDRLGSNPGSLEGNEELKQAIEKVVAVVIKSCSPMPNRSSEISSSSGVSSLRISGCTPQTTADVTTDQDPLSQIPPDVQQLFEVVGAAVFTSRRSTRDPNRSRRHVPDQLDCVEEEQDAPKEKPET